jgi:nicotinamide phosphoribosyltransferase
METLLFADTNPILTLMDNDSYIPSHFRQLPPDTEYTFAYLESRGGRYGEMLWNGLQHILRRLTTPVRKEHVEAAARFHKVHGEPFPIEGWMRIVEKHDGLIPLKIRALPEATIVPSRNALLTVRNTDPALPWLPSWFETQKVRTWLPLNTGTRSLYCKRVIWKHLVKTSMDPKNEVLWKLHDFGSRGAGSRESASIAGTSHLINFLGTDTVIAMLFAAEQYKRNDPKYQIMSPEFEKVLGGSIPAMAHYTVTSWKRANEVEAYRNMIRANPEFKLLAAVSDSYDIFNAVENLWCEELLEEVQMSGKTIVIRPDSGDPVDVNLRIMRIIDRKLGMRENMKGYKVLPDCFRIIQGDGNDDEESIDRVLTAITNAGFSATNINFGMGGGLHQLHNRDTQKIAYKTSAAKPKDGDWYSFKKDPVTDPGKTSKEGILDVIKEGGVFKTVQMPTPEPHRLTEMVDVFENGRMLKEFDFEEMRARAWREFA